MSRLPAKLLIGAATTVLVLACSTAVLARSSDRNKEMLIDAGKTSGTLDDRQPTVLSGGVKIIQGTLNINANNATITSRGGEVARAVLTGGPVTLKQELDDGTPINSVANRVDYDLTTEIVVFTGAVTIQKPDGTLKSERVVYNMKTGQVNSGGEGGGRVQMRILPKKKGGG